ncbi:MAG: tyrosine--tRNA ligase, partial [Patescibacteria group bacterium]
NLLIEGLDGRKMSSSWGNTVNLFDSADEMFGKIMSLKDEFIIKYFTFATRVDLQKTSEYEKLLAVGENPRNIKSKLAKEIVRMYHGEKEAEKAEEEFNKIFRNKEMPSDMPVFETAKKIYPILDLLFDAKLTPSKSEAKRLVEQNAVEINKEKITDWKKEISLENEMVIKVGSRRFIKIIISLR